jgi:hypothetical protein
MRIEVAVLALAACALCDAHAGRALAQTVVAQSASLSGAANKITVARLPVQGTGGTTSYFDLTLTLTPLSSGGTVTGVKVAGTSAPSQTVDISGFSAGTYVDAFGNAYTVNGPGAGPDGSTAWSLTVVAPKNCAPIYSATWYTDTGTNNPEAPRLKAAKITTTAESFGVDGMYAVDCYTNQFEQGALLGVQHTGGGISISSYSNNGTDYSSPTGNLTLTPQQ